MRNIDSYDDYEEYAITYYNEVVERLKKICEIKECSQGALSLETGIAQPTISKMFAGEVKISLIHIAKFCKALKIEPEELLADNSSKSSTCVDEEQSNDILLSNPTHMAFRGYMGEYNVYFNSTISSEDKILRGKMEFTSSENKEECLVKMELYTGKVKGGKEITKHYEGKLIISLSMSACYCILTAKDIGEMCFLVFNHIFLCNEDLACRLACAITVSAGGNKRPTMHRILLCRDKLDVSNSDTEDYKFLRGHLILNSSEIILSRTSFLKMKESEEVLKTSPEMIELLNYFTSQSEDDTFYKIDESIIRSAPYPMETKLGMITMLREYSIEKKYNKISSKADEYVYSYLNNRADLD